MTDDDMVFWDELFAGLKVVADPVEGHWIERLLPDAAARAAISGRVLELGCATGYLSERKISDSAKTTDYDRWQLDVSAAF